MIKPFTQLIFHTTIFYFVNPHAFQNLTPLQSLLFDRISFLYYMTREESGTSHTQTHTWPTSVLWLLSMLLVTSRFPAIVLLVFLFFFSLILSTLCQIKHSKYNNVIDVAALLNVWKMHFLCFDFHSSKQYTRLGTSHACLMHIWYTREKIFDDNYILTWLK
jgi:hypothetical protein